MIVLSLARSQKPFTQRIIHPVSVIFLCVKFALFVLLALRLTTHKNKIINQ
nr:MAG TPA: hypothetical protein [Caudoviricetes sp.]